ncbi:MULTISPECIES: glycosyltransferase family 2 protein [Vibrio]|uniref:Glycosyltransferase n=2 Tax=Vibrio TaxID=662 RepID=A0A7X4LP38_9VIBR|nr:MULTISPECIES: glycosyltransferase family 2 protein [Vibrio]MBF9002142.1 glycosyltransferase family 2 protein [Vibrio nitrifigilis]MZI95553.1 glycosyltransferase [Vibrio eleionomae]
MNSTYDSSSATNPDKTVRVEGISIIIATCNRPELAYRAVKSVVAQSLVEKQIVVVNNGSSVENQAHYQTLFAELAEQIEYVDLCTSQAIGVGPSIARNVGLSYVTGKYVTFCDDDDEWIDPEYLANIAQSLRKYQPDILFSDQKAIQANGTVKAKHWFDNDALLHSSVPLDDGDIYQVEASYFYQHGGFPHLNITVYNYELISQWGGFCKALDYEEDFELFHRLLSHSNLLLYYDQVVSLHHIPDQQYQDNVTTAMNQQHKQLSRLYIFTKLTLESLSPQLSRFARIHASYAAARLAEFALEKRDFALAKQMSKQAISWRLSPKMALLFGYTVLRSCIAAVGKTQR